MTPVSELRIEKCNGHPVNPDGRYVIYWMIANRRTAYNFSLQRAVEWAKELDRPLLVFEALRCGYQWASDRIHRFVIEGMVVNRQRLKEKGVFSYHYLEPEKGGGKGLLAALAQDACVVVTDDFPCFFLPRMLNSAAGQLPVLLEKVDSNGILPLAWTDRVFTTAASFRRYLQKNLDPHLYSFPEADPLQDAATTLPTLESLPKPITDKWPRMHHLERGSETIDLRELPIDHSVAPVKTVGGAAEAEKRLKRFVEEILPAYDEYRNHPDEEASSGLSPYLHFGHISAHGVLAAVAAAEDWTPDRVAPSATGKREGWWGMSANAEAFLDQLITWRELGYNMCRNRTDYDHFDSLPDWARTTLARHEHDVRPYIYTSGELERAETHDELWNAAQRQLIREGTIHNYLRMLWGKKILEWSTSPKEALRVMIELNNKYALDGRNPNSYCGIFWILGRYDRAWGPERPIFGKIRYMSSDSARKKLRLKRFLGR